MKKADKVGKPKMLPRSLRQFSYTVQVPLSLHPLYWHNLSKLVAVFWLRAGPPIFSRRTSPSNYCSKVHANISKAGSMTLRRRRNRFDQVVHRFVRSTSLQLWREGTFL